MSIDKMHSTSQIFQSPILDIISRDSMANSKKKKIHFWFHSLSMTQPSAPPTDPQTFAPEPTDTNH